MTATAMYVTVNTFDENKIVFDNIAKYSEPIAYKKIPIKYMYENNREGPLIIRTHKMFTYGILENRDMKTGEIHGYSLPLASYDKNNGRTKDDEKFYNMIECITCLCRDYVCRNEERLKSKACKHMNTESLSIWKYKEDTTKYAPAMFIKLMTKHRKPIEIYTPFKKIT